MPPHLFSIVGKGGLHTLHVGRLHDQVNSLPLAYLDHTSEDPWVVVTEGQSSYGHSLQCGEIEQEV